MTAEIIPLRDCRAILDLTHAEIGHLLRLGGDDATVSRKMRQYVSGHRPPSGPMTFAVDLLIAVAEALDDLGGLLDEISDEHQREALRAVVDHLDLAIVP